MREARSGLRPCARGPAGPPQGRAGQQQRRADRRDDSDVPARERQAGVAVAVAGTGGGLAGERTARAAGARAPRTLGAALGARAEAGTAAGAGVVVLGAVRGGTFGPGGGRRPVARGARRRGVLGAGGDRSDRADRCALGTRGPGVAGVAVVPALLLGRRLRSGRAVSARRDDVVAVVVTAVRGQRVVGDRDPHERVGHGRGRVADRRLAVLGLGLRLVLVRVRLRVARVRVALAVRSGGAARAVAVRRDDVLIVLVTV